MYRALLLIFLLVGASFGAKSDSVRIMALSAKVDSLSQILKDAQLAASYSEKTLEVTKEVTKNANSNLWIQFGIFVAAVISVFVAASVVMGLWIKNRTDREQEAIANMVRDQITPGFNARIDTQNENIGEIGAQLNQHEKTYYKFGSVIEKDIQNLQSSDANQNSDLASLKEKTKEITKKVEGVEFQLLVNEFVSNTNVIDKFIDENNLSAAVLKAIDCVKSYPAPGEHKIIYKQYSTKLLRIILLVKEILPETKILIEDVYSCLLETDRNGIEQALNGIPIHQRSAPTTISQQLLGVPLPEGVI